jgi:hypothetical protein
MEPEQARATYVKLIMELDPAWSSAVDEAALPSPRKQSWVVFSSMQDNGCSLPPPPPRFNPVFTPRCRDSYGSGEACFRQTKLTMSLKFLLISLLTPVHHSAAVAGRMDIIRSMLDARTHVDTRDENQQTMSLPTPPPIPSPCRPSSHRLHVACDRGHLQLAQLLLSAAADPNAVEANGSSALHLAAAVENFEAVQLLINAGAVSPSSTHASIPRLYSLYAGARVDALDSDGEKCYLLEMIIFKQFPFRSLPFICTQMRCQVCRPQLARRVRT